MRILVLVVLILFISGCEERLSPEEIATKIQEKQASSKDYSGKIQTTTYIDGKKDLDEEIQKCIRPNLVRSIAVENGNRTVSLAEGELLWIYASGTNIVMKMKLLDDPFLKKMDILVPRQSYNFE